MLSRKAVIPLRPPRDIAPSAPDFQYVQKQWLVGKWHVVHSTDPERYSGTDASSPVILVFRDRDDMSTSMATLASAADLDTERITKLLPIPRADWQTVSSLVDDIPDRRWEVLAWGKEGELEPWMVEDGSGWWIGDSISGEWRADWRNSYVVVFFTDLTEEDDEEYRIEIWSRFAPPRALSYEMVYKIRNSLYEVPRRYKEKAWNFGTLIACLEPVNS